MSHWLIQKRKTNPIYYKRHFWHFSWKVNGMETMARFYQLPKAVILNTQKLRKRVEHLQLNSQCLIEYRDEKGMAYLRAFGQTYDDAFWKMKGLLEDDQYQLEY